MKLKNNKGFTGVDVAISTVILIVFVSFMAMLFYNISMSTKQIERKSKASQLAIQVIEAMKMTPFDNLNDYGTKTGAEEIEYQDVTQDEIKELTSQDITFENGYSVAIYVEDYNSQQIVKILGVKVSYPYVKDTIDTVEIKTLLKKEIIQSDETTTTKKPIVNTLKVGDYVYIYLTKPYQAILFECLVIEADIVDMNSCTGKSMKLQLKKCYDKNDFKMDKLKKYGLKSVRSARRISYELYLVLHS